MTQPTLYFVALIFTAGLSWWPGNWLVWAIWKVSAKIEGVSHGTPSPMVKSVGTFERVLYVMGVMGHHYEIIAGWLVLKAFFGFMGRDEVGVRLRPETSEELLRRYNGLLVGNATSLMIGIALGVIANIIIRWRSGVHLSWAL